jgi:hypothetical protein
MVQQYRTRLARATGVFTNQLAANTAAHIAITPNASAHTCVRGVARTLANVNPDANTPGNRPANIHSIVAASACYSFDTTSAA